MPGSTAAFSEGWPLFFPGRWEEQDAPGLSCNPAAPFKPHFFISFHNLYFSPLPCWWALLLAQRVHCLPRQGWLLSGRGHRFLPAATGIGGTRC